MPYFIGLFAIFFAGYAFADDAKNCKDLPINIHDSAMTTIAFQEVDEAEEAIELETFEVRYRCLSAGHSEPREHNGGLGHYGTYRKTEQEAMVSACYFCLAGGHYPCAVVSCD